MAYEAFQPPQHLHCPGRLAEARAVGLKKEAGHHSAGPHTTITHLEASGRLSVELLEPLTASTCARSTPLAASRLAHA